MPVIEEVPQVVKTAVTLMPALQNIPGLGKIIIALNRVPNDDTKALEELKKQADRGKRTREDTQKKNSRYVIKVSEAMKCVDKGFDANLVLTFLKSMGRILVGGQDSLADQMRNGIYQCLEENRLRQDTPRVLQTKKRYHRPSKGHGHGRGHF